MRRKKLKPLINFILIGSLAGTFISSGILRPLTANATTVEDIQQQNQRYQEALEAILSEIAGMEGEQDVLQEQIDDLNAEILNTMTCIGLKEDEIAAKENEISIKAEEISLKEDEIVQKQFQIEQTEAEYDAAVEREETQRQNMAVCARMLYENDMGSYLSALLEGEGLADVLNRMDYVEKIYSYERTVLLDYIDTKNQVHDLWDFLEEEKAGLEADKVLLVADRESLEEDRRRLEDDRAELQGQKSSLNTMLARKEQESANYAAEIEKARQEAAVQKTLIQQNEQKIKDMLAAQAAAGQTPANTTYATTNYTTVIDNASGSELGKQIAKYACQYIGNPYVLGGTSLTSGADCSGFTYRIYSNFGYTIPRTSYQQRTAGKSVSYAEAQPGDLICYDGHVAMYIGNGLIVHASNSQPYPSGGIKVSQATYRTILAVRRII